MPMHAFPSSATVHGVKRKRRCGSCRGTGLDFSSPQWGVGDMRDILVGYAACFCRRAR